MSVPHFTRPIAGFRNWKVAPNRWSQMGGYLWAAVQLEPWPTDRDHEAHCTMSKHTAPQRDCHCGVYAWYSPLQLVDDGFSASFEDPAHVTGIISAWGDIEPGTLMFRAQYARVEAIFDHPSMPKVVLPVSKEDIAEAYGAAIISPLDYEAFCEERGLILIDPDTLD